MKLKQKNKSAQMPYTVTNISETTQLSNLVLQKTIGFIGIVKNIPNAGIMVV